MTKTIVERITEQAAQFYIDNNQKFGAAPSSAREILKIQTAMLIGASIALEQQAEEAKAVERMDRMLEEIFKIKGENIKVKDEGIVGCRGGMIVRGKCPP